MADAQLQRPRWGHKTSLFQWNQPALYLYGLFVIGSFALVSLEQAALSSLSPGGWLLSWFLLAIVGVPMFILIYRLDLYEREPLSLVFGALIWGGIAAIALASLANVGWLLFLLTSQGPEFTSEWGAAIVAPFTEETIKGAGVVLLYLIARDEFDDMLDGFVYGAVVGLGFMLVEDVFYFVANFGGTTEGVLKGFALRVIASGLYGHVLYTALTGMGVAYFTSRTGRVPLGQRLLVAIGLFLIGVVGHFLWNSPLLDFFPDDPFASAGAFLQTLFAAAVKGVPLLLFVALLVKLAHRREHRWLEAALAGEVGQPGLTQEEWEQLRTPRSRRRARAEMRRRAGTRGAAVLHRLQRQQINLAMIATRVDGDHPDLLRQREYCRSLRDYIAGLPGARPPASTGAGPPATAP
ncbi:MAG TPA: PrsW family intramembrane metalloprotease [Actinomycetota bacterium]|nr:PrsW family intramembrane metalloprotease [Actinomycetota bacterium]